jgi:superfamily II DNA or RNA helicase/HKD family nuclease
MSRVELVTRNLVEKLIPAIERATSVYMVVSFVMESGVRILKPHLEAAIARGADVKILTGDYLYVTEPEALAQLLDLGEQAEIRLWRSQGEAFHPKAYILGEDGGSTVVIGSSNLSRSALTTGVEWNLAVDSSVAPSTVQESYQEFMRLFYHPQTIPLNAQTLAEYRSEYEAHYKTASHNRNPWTDAESGTHQSDVAEPGDRVREPSEEYTAITPNPAQEAALEELDKCIEEGYDKAMVVMATGLGKTYLAAFFAGKFRRVLFVAHREEILHQAARSFKNVLPERRMGIYNGLTKEPDADCIFASIFTLAMARHRAVFQPDEFDLIVVDEFHHAAARSYQTLLEYFRPKFLLGITATPDRSDGKDIFALCDGNVAYRMHFIEAVQNGWLCPFRYYGVYDETDYSKITWRGNRYDEAELLAVQLREEMARAIHEAWLRHRQTRTLAFCSSIQQADFLARYFKQQGVRAISLHSHTQDVSRREAIEGLENGRFEVIFTVDLFNEGVDIPRVDTLLFVRPTESLTVFTQQIGRGLRLHPDKTHCHIIDLIGNYRNADVKMRVFDVRSAWDDDRRGTVVTVPVVPDNCEIHLDTKVVDLIREMARKRSPRKERLLENYRQVKRELGRRPTYLELHLHSDLDARAYKQEFGSFAGFLKWAGELSDTERVVYETHQPWLQEVEATVMTKSYKMVLLLAMLERGPHHWFEPIRAEEAAPFFHRYLTEKEYRKQIDFSHKKTRRLWDYDARGVSRLIATMPMSKWAGSSKGLVTFDGDEFRLEFPVRAEDAEWLYRWTREICEYRLHAYFERKAKA